MDNRFVCSITFFQQYPQAHSSKLSSFFRGRFLPSFIFQIEEPSGGKMSFLSNVTADVISAYVISGLIFAPSSGCGVLTY